MLFSEGIIHQLEIVSKLRYLFSTPPPKKAKKSMANSLMNKKKQIPHLVYVELG